MFGFTTDQILSALRSLLKIAGGYLVANGIASQDATNIGIGVVIALTGLAFSIVHHTLANASSAEILGPADAAK